MNRPVLVAVGGVVIIAVAVGLSLWNKLREEAPRPSVPTEQTTAESPTAAKPAEQTNVPSFDVVRINPEGETVIAGRALPHAQVTILDGEAEIGHVTADNRGEWVFVPDKPLPPGSRELSLKAVNPDGTTTRTEAPVVLVVPDRTKDKNASLAVKVNPDGTIDILQGPAAQAGTGPISILGVRYDAKGHLAVSGNATPNAYVQLYLDGRPLTRVKTDDKGQWKTAPRPALPKGSHTVRADELSSGGTVSGRAEISFTLPESVPGNNQITVEPGNSLWRIARRTYGSGFDYMVIFEANKGQIRDPNLIYPGQVFNIPPAR